ncbi:hypothetical protein BCO18430_06870 [Burkholderia contaminans]|nr:hypothetical protein BCO18430_06870 [Burkholderia contaminans]
MLRLSYHDAQRTHFDALYQFPVNLVLSTGGAKSWKIHSAMSFWTVDRQVLGLNGIDEPDLAPARCNCRIESEHPWRLRFFTAQVASAYAHTNR